MRKDFTIFTLTVILAIFLNSAATSGAAQFSIGVSPSVVDLGELEKGSTHLVKFYLVTPSPEPLLIYLESGEGRLDFFQRDNYKGFDVNYSEERTASWVEFLKNPVELKPANESIKTNTGIIEGWREINFLLNVPEDAEPGYHLLNIKPVPSIPSESVGEAGAKVVAITSVNILFKVPGHAEREGIILDVVSGGQVGNNVEINTYFKNTGTETISSRAFQQVFNNDNVINITSSRAIIGPGETKILKTFLPINGFSEGEYNVYTKVDYTTDFKSKNSTISMFAPAVLVPEEGPEFRIPIWLIILVIIIIIGILSYRWKNED